MLVAHAAGGTHLGKVRPCARPASERLAHAAGTTVAQTGYPEPLKPATRAITLDCGRHPTSWLRRGPWRVVPRRTRKRSASRGPRAAVEKHFPKLPENGGGMLRTLMTVTMAAGLAAGGLSGASTTQAGPIPLRQIANQVPAAAHLGALIGRHNSEASISLAVSLALRDWPGSMPSSPPCQIPPRQTTAITSRPPSSPAGMPRRQPNGPTWSPTCAARACA